MKLLDPSAAHDTSAANLVAATSLPHAHGRQRAEILFALLAMHYLPVLRDAFSRLFARAGETASDPAAMRAMLPVVADAGCSPGPSRATRWRATWCGLQTGSP